MIAPPSAGLSARIIGQMDRAALFLTAPLRWIGWAPPDPNASPERLAPALWKPCLAIAVVTALFGWFLAGRWHGLHEAIWHAALFTVLTCSSGLVAAFRLRHPILRKPEWERDERERLVARHCRTAALATLAVTLGLALCGCLGLLVADFGRPVGTALIWRVVAMGIYAQFAATVAPMVAMAWHDRNLRRDDDEAAISQTG